MENLDCIQNLRHQFEMFGQENAKSKDLKETMGRIRPKILEEKKRTAEEEKLKLDDFFDKNETC